MFCPILIGGSFAVHCSLERIAERKEQCAAIEVRCDDRLERIRLTCIRPAAIWNGDVGIDWRSGVVCVIVPSGLVTQPLEDIELDCNEWSLVIEGQCSSGLKRVQEDGTPPHERSVISKTRCDSVH